MFRSVPTVFTALVLVFVFTLTGCNFPWERSIKLIDVDDKNINLEIDGKKAHIPLPEGYVVADRELYAKLYERREATASKSKSILLGIFVNIDDDKIRKKDSKYIGYRYCVFMIYDFYKEQRFKEEKFESEIKQLKKDFTSILQETNQELVKKGRSTFTESTIFENKCIISKCRIEDWESQGEYRVGYSQTYFTVDSVIITLLLYHDISNQHDIEQLEDETLTYVKSIGKQ